MHRITRYTRFVFGLMVVTALLLSALGGVHAQDGKKILKAGYLVGDVVLDPSLATDVTSITVLESMYIGLTPQDEVTSEVVPGMAESWEVSDDGLTYTYHLVQNVPWVRYNPDTDEVTQETDENGAVRYVTAYDFVYGWTRTLDPATASDYAYVLALAVAGGAEFNAGDAGVELGVKALDEWTLQVVSPLKAAFVPMIHGMWMARPQPQWAIEEYGDGWTLPGNFPTYGSYTLKEWDPGVRVVMVKNPFWPGTEGFPVAKIDEIYLILLEESALLAAYEAGELDYDNALPSPDLARLKAERPDELYTGPQDCTYYYGFNVLKAPVDNVHMRRALSMAVDRQAIVTLLGAGQQPAGFFSRPNFAASPKQEDYPGFGIKSDPEGAKAELQAYFDETGTTLADLPPITLMHNTSQGHARIAQAIQQMWKETLGIEVQITNQEFQTYLTTLDEDAPQVWRLGWCKDYPDPDNFLATVFYSTSGNNDTNWANPKFDALVDEARAEQDLQKRKDLYAQAEDILTREDAAMIPIYFYTHSDLTQGYVTRTYSQTGNERFDKWDVTQ